MTRKHEPFLLGATGVLIDCRQSIGFYPHDSISYLRSHRPK
jgi:hypothetical protein